MSTNESYGPAQAGMRLAFVVQRYGLEVNGGAEYHCRQMAERLARCSEVAQVTVLTTCARDYSNWRNYYQPGHERINGVHVERFAVAAERRELVQTLLGSALACSPHPRFLEWAWLNAQGPMVPDLVERLSAVHAAFDAITFFTYLYYPTVLGIQVPMGNRILWPTAHDEPAIRLGLFRDVFRAPEAIAFNSEEEREFVTQRFAIAGKPHDVIGCGIESRLESNDCQPRPLREPYVLYLGRIAKHKGTHRLVEYFTKFKQMRRGRRFEGHDSEYPIDELKLVLAGAGQGNGLGRSNDVIVTGFLSDDEKARWLGHCEVLVMPSHFESLSLVTLEAWAASRPVLVDSRCAVTHGHVLRSRGGLAYADRLEFGTSLDRLLQDRQLRRDMADNGARYVRQCYGWPEVQARFLELVRSVVSRNHALNSARGENRDAG